MNVKVLIFLGLVAVVAGDKRPVYGDIAEEDSSEESFESSEAKYSFTWAVSDDSSSNEFGHEESRDGDDTRGSYYVELPDGRLQTVRYFVEGDSGYVAEVTYGSTESDESNESK
ncbi:pro-resilin-like [Macrobrachium nipponense]|uniref:pro-resilin-like n=1 Tax=Macrobrachium nipponense TaxID=159736 RepID=UPI0030C7D150